jgi:hypothetical protein
MGEAIANLVFGQDLGKNLIKSIQYIEEHTKMIIEILFIGINKYVGVKIVGKNAIGY